MPTLWLFDIEPHEQRYTSEWSVHLPNQLRTAMGKSKKPWKLEVVQGGPTSGAPSTGAFLNFAESNAYKGCQVAEFSLAVHQRQVRKGDRVLFTDAWHPSVINVRYMSDLLGLGLTIDVMWHAGSYDRWDFLGRAVRNKNWSIKFENAVYEAADRNFFATAFHRNMFRNVIRPRSLKSSRVIGWPMEYLPPMLSPLAGSVTKDTIIFPHRMAPEKQPAVLQALQPQLSQYRFVFAQSQFLTKQQYHRELARSLVVFSASKQETLGIGVYEGLLAGAAPVIPNRLSYKEIYPGWCYPSSWTSRPQAVAKHSRNLVSYIQQAIHQKNPKKLASLANRVGNRFFNGSKFYGSVLR